VGFVIIIYDIDNTWVRVVFSTAETTLSFFLAQNLLRMQPKTAGNSENSQRASLLSRPSTAHEARISVENGTRLADNFMRNSKNSKSVPRTQAWRSLLATKVRPEWPMPALPDRGWQST
jgi:hypothetical protein